MDVSLAQADGSVSVDCETVMREASRAICRLSTIRENSATPQQGGLMRASSTSCLLLILVGSQAAASICIGMGLAW